MSQSFRGVPGKIPDKSQPLSAAEICGYIDNHEKYTVYTTDRPPPSEPQSGSIILYDKNKVKTETIRKDGHLWEKGKNGKVYETHATPKGKGGVVLHGYYAYLEADGNFQRRIYWKDRDEPDAHIGLVQYLIINKGSRKRKKANYEQGSEKKVTRDAPLQTDCPQSELAGPSSGINDHAAHTESSFISPVEACQPHHNILPSIDDWLDNDGHNITESQLTGATANDQLWIPMHVLSADFNDTISFEAYYTISIEEFSPDWSYEYTATRVLICGTFPNSSQVGEDYQWTCFFGVYEVDAVYLPKSGSLLCLTPKMKAGRVIFQVKRRLKTAGSSVCSEEREFEFRVRQNQVIDCSTWHTSVELPIQGHQNHAGYIAIDTSVEPPIQGHQNHAGYNVLDIAPPNWTVDCAEMLESVQAESQGSNEIVVDSNEDSDGQSHEKDAMQILRSKMAARRLLTNSVSDQDRPSYNYQIRGPTFCDSEIAKGVTVNSMQNNFSSLDPLRRKVVMEEDDQVQVKTTPSLLSLHLMRNALQCENMIRHRQIHHRSFQEMEEADQVLKGYYSIFTRSPSLRSVYIMEEMNRIVTRDRIMGERLLGIGYQLDSQNGAKGAWWAVPELTEFTVGLDVPLKELKMKVFQDGVSMHVVTAPGGFGKTTLATKFCQDEQVIDKFKNNIFFVSVRDTPNLSSIVQELYQRKGSQMPTFQDELTAVKCLQTFLKAEGQKPLLLVLDGVWSGSDSILDKFQFETTDCKMPDYKILVTSRSEFPRFGSSYHLQSLDYDNAMKLFHHAASLGDKSSNIPACLSRQIVQGCKGLPLAITVVGGALRGRSIEIWERGLGLFEWSKGSCILDSKTELLLRLQSSVLVGSDKEMAIIRECFLDLGSFPEDRRIPVPVIDIWAESYDQLDEDILCVAYIHKLANQSLANLLVTRKGQRQGDGYYNNSSVRMHDLIREVAFNMARQEDPGKRGRLIINITGDKLPKWWSEKKYESMKARLVSISTDETFSSKWHHMELPEAEVLVLNFQTKNYALPKFLETMHKLKVLVVTNYGFSPAELSSIPLLGSLSHLKRIRLERVSIPSITKNPIQLVGLKKLFLFMCTIGKAFSDGSIQISQAFPNLEEISIDFCNDLVEVPADLCDLIHLRKLSVTNSHKLLALPEEIGKLENLELLRLRSCTVLKQLPSSSRNLKKLICLDISYCFSMMELPEDIGEMSSLRKLNMRECFRMQEVPITVLDLKHLEEVVCDDETRNLWEPLHLTNTEIVVEKENINLNWLHKLQS